MKGAVTMKHLRYAALLALASLGLAACVPASPATVEPGAPSQSASGSSGGRTLVAVVRVEPESAALRAP